MGASESKSSDREPSRMVTLRVIEATVQDLQYKVALGFESENEDYYSALTEASTIVQGIRSHTTNKKSIRKCEDILNNINIFLRTLEESPNSVESNLDLEAIDSASFIFHDSNDDRIDENNRSLTHIEDKMKVLDQEIRTSVLNNNGTNLTILKKSVVMLLKDLEEVHPNQDTPAMKKKEKLVKILIKFKNKITAVLKNSEPFSDPPDFTEDNEFKPQEEVDCKINQILQDLQASLGTTLKNTNTPQASIANGYSTEANDPFIIDKKLQRQSYKVAGTSSSTTIASSSKLGLNEQQLDFNHLKTDGSSNSLIEVQCLMEGLQKIDRINNAILDIQNSINKFKGTIDGDVFDSLEFQLMFHKEDLESIKDYNQDIAENKLKTLDKLQPILEKLHEKSETTIHNSSTANKNNINTLLGNIMTIDVTVHILEKKIEKFAGKPEDKDYQKIIVTLNENKVLLEAIDPLNHDNIKTAKINVLGHIHRLQKGNKILKRHFPTNFKHILKQIKRIARKIRSFHGIYRSSRYLHLENRLHQLIIDLATIKDKNEKIMESKRVAKERIQKLLEALEAISVKPKTQALEEIIRASLLDIEDRIESFEGYKDENYYKIIYDLNDCNHNVKLLGDDGGAAKIEYLQCIEDLFTYMHEKVANHQGTLPKNQQRSLEELDEIEEEFNKLKPQITNSKINGGDTAVLVNALLGFLLKCNNIKTFGKPAIQEKRKQIVLSLYEFVDILEDDGIEDESSNDESKVLECHVPVVKADITKTMNEVYVDKTKHSSLPVEASKVDQGLKNLEASSLDFEYTQEAFDAIKTKFELLSNQTAKSGNTKNFRKLTEAREMSKNQHHGQRKPSKLPTEA